MNICVYGASSDTIDEVYINQGYELGRVFAKQGHTIIFGAGATGVMGAVARGAHDNGGYLIGVAPEFFDVDGVLYKECNELIYTETMRERKQIMEDKAEAFVMAPGGIGTFEEFFEIYTLKQLNRHNKDIVVLNVNNYYAEIIQMLEKAVKENFMSEANLNLFTVVNDVAEFEKLYK